MTEGDLLELAQRRFHPHAELKVDGLPPNADEVIHAWTVTVHCGLNFVSVMRVGRGEAMRTMRKILEKWEDGD